MLLIAAGGVVIVAEGWRSYSLLDKAVTGVAAKAARSKLEIAARESWRGMALAGVGVAVLFLSLRIRR